MTTRIAAGGLKVFSLTAALLAALSFTLFVALWASRERVQEVAREFDTRRTALEAHFDREISGLNLRLESTTNEFHRLQGDLKTMLGSLQQLAALGQKVDALEKKLEDLTAKVDALRRAGATQNRSTFGVNAKRNGEGQASGAP